MVADPSAEQLSVHRGMLMADSAYVYETRHGGGLKVTGQRSVVTTQLFKHKVGAGALEARSQRSRRLGRASAGVCELGIRLQGSHVQTARWLLST